MYLQGELMCLFSWIPIIQNKCSLPHVDISKPLSDELRDEVNDNFHMNMC